VTSVLARLDQILSWQEQLGGVDLETYRQAEASGRVAQDIPVNHSPYFAPVIHPTLDTGTQALVVAALAWLA
jgi:hippurate hydrolase